ncbi:hypothetical protein PABG_12101 [Paracoccidioides brasiliensis Pb03]|nr:hypothetical protein PABG_12101 [Paracoccidioides brasiliensis Pb03]
MTTRNPAAHANYPDMALEDTGWLAGGLPYARYALVSITGGRALQMTRRQKEAPSPSKGLAGAAPSQRDYQASI